LERANSNGEQQKRHLERNAANTALIGDIRGLGPILAIDLVTDRVKKHPAAEAVISLCQAVLQRWLIILPCGLHFNCVRFLPPLMINDELIYEGIAVLAQVFELIE
jgi:4-aminobutyrate aminotransferase/(S)-3-amino-2-methylpropionate transaminase